METTNGVRIALNTPRDIDAFRRLILSVAPAASTDTARGALHMVEIEATGDTVRVTATNSYYLATATMVAPADTPTATVLVPAKWIATAMKQHKRNDHTASLDITGDAYTYTTQHGAVSTPSVHTPDYPRWRPLIPGTPDYNGFGKGYGDDDEGSPYRVNAAYLADIGRMVDALHGKSTPTVDITHIHSRRPWRLDAEHNGVTWTGILMPVRVA